MSSTSSSECMCPDCLQYGVNFRTVQAKNPFYQTFGQPLIYYAQMKQKPHFCDKRCKESRKCEPNWFVRTFRWYTQEHTAIRSSKSRSRDNNKRDMSEFALWLDKKYNEFLTEKQNNNCCPTTPKNTPTCGDDKMITSARQVPPPPPCDSCETKTFSRVRSPWSKKHRSRERTTTIEKRLQSLEFILEPKELSRPASEFCQETPTYKRSKISVVSSESRISKKTIIKTRISEKNISDKKRTSNEINRIVGPNITKLKEVKPLKSSERPEDKKQQIYYSAKDVSCQCPETKLVTVDAHTQYCDSDWSKDTYLNCTCPPRGNMLLSGPTQQVNKKRSDCSCQYSLDAIPKYDTASQYTAKYRNVESHCVLGATAYNWKDSSKDQKDCYKVCDNSQGQSQPPKYLIKDVNKKRSNCSCQCSLDVIPKNDTASQYTNKYRNVKSHCVLGSTAYNWNDSSQNRKDYCKEIPLIITRCVNCPCEPIRIQKSLKTKDNLTSTDVINNKNRFVKISSKGVALQTSDNSIDLERDGVRKYPLFMKIVYADKLKEDRPRL